MQPFIKRNKEINRVVLLPLEQITSSRHQPRKYFDKAAITELAASIAVNGLLQPVTVRKQGDNSYELIAGERRTMAYRSLGRDKIPAIVEEMDDTRSAALTLIENLQRMDLHYLEEAAGIAAYMRQEHQTQQQAARQLGKAQSTIANKLRLLTFDDHIRAHLMETNLTERHARALLKLENTEQIAKAIDHVEEQSLTVEQTEQYVEQVLEEAAPPPPKGTKLVLIRDVRIFLNTLNKAVNVMKLAGILVDTNTIESEEYLEYTVKVPKNTAYRSRGSAIPQQLSIL